MQTIQKFNRGYPSLFNIGDNEEDNDDDRGGESIADGFVKRYGWIYSTTLIAEHERITLDEAWELPIMQCMNALLYLKAKKNHDSELIKTWQRV